MSALRQDVFKLRDNQLRTRALVNEIRCKLRETDRRLGMLSARVDDIPECAVWERPTTQYSAS
jgi:hypothetical protein